jgi:hypothetical protein
VPDIAGDALSPPSLSKIRKTDLKKLPVMRSGTRLGPCVSSTRHFIAIGLNYIHHAKETNAEIPKEPIVFAKAPTSISGPYDDVILPKGSRKSDWEVELCIVIGSRAQYVSEDKAMDAVAGYCICNDISEREFQLERGPQWAKGKGCATFGPIGPWLVTKDEIEDVESLDLFLDVNGHRLQNSTTKNMILAPSGLSREVMQRAEFLNRNFRGSRTRDLGTRGEAAIWLSTARPTLGRRIGSENAHSHGASRLRACASHDEHAPAAVGLAPAEAARRPA